MSEIQLRHELGILSAQASYSANQFPQTTEPQHCSDFKGQPNMMIYYKECVPDSGIVKDICAESSVTGPRVSVMNDNYPGQRDRSRYHLCECEIHGPKAQVVLETLDSRLNCSNGHPTQNLTLYGDNESVLNTWNCTFVYGISYNLNGSNWTLVWNGHINGTLGNFWIGFKAKDNTNITISCRPIPDPTTTTSTTTTTTTATTTTSTATTINNGTQSNIKGKTDAHQPVANGSFPATSTPTGDNHVMTTDTQNPATTSLWLYVGGGAAGLVVLIVVISVVVCVRRRSQPQIIELGSLKLPTEILPDTTAPREEPDVPRHPDIRPGRHRSAGKDGNMDEHEHRPPSTSKQREASSSKRRSDSIELETNDKRVKQRRENANLPQVTETDGHGPPRASEKRTKRQRSIDEKGTIDGSEGTIDGSEDPLSGTSSHPRGSVSKPRSDSRARDNLVMSDKRRQPN